MFFKLPVQVYEGENCVMNHSKEFAKLGSRALIVTGRYSAKINGSLVNVMEALDLENITYAVFDQVEENPSVETIMKAREFGLEQRVDFVVGIGGGSPMDAAKAIALMLYYEDEDESFLFAQEEDPQSLPVVAVPTTCGTGSEVTGIAVLTRHEMRTKSSMTHRIFPTLALVDAKYLECAPKKVLCSTAVDALAHLLESYLNTNATDYSRMFVREGLMVWSKCKEVLTGDREPQKEDYRNLMNASTYAGMAIAHTGTGIPHGLSYYVTYECQVAHGKACGYFLAGYLREAAQEDQDYLLNLAGFSSVEELAAFIDQICELTPVPQELLAQAVEGISSNQAKLKSCPYPVDKSVLRRIVGLE